MKSRKQFNFHKLFVIGAIVLGVGFFLFSLIFTRVIDKPEMKTTEMEIPDQKRETVLELPGQSTIHVPKPPSAADIKAAIAVLENMDTSESRDEGVEGAGDDVNAVMQVADSGNKTPLSYEEKLAQRYLLISETLEFQEANYEFGYFPMLDLDALDTSARDALEEHDRNPYAMFGYTQEEYESGMDLPAEEYNMVIAEGTRLQQEVDAEMERNASIVNEYNRKQAELHQRRLDVLGMTNEEFEVAIAEYRRLYNAGELDRLRKL